MAALPLITSIGGGLLSGLAKPKTKTNTTQDTTQTTNEQSQSNSEYNQLSENEGLTMPIEDPLDYLFRQSLYGGLAKEFGKANKPLFGEAEKAGFLSDLNDLAGSSLTAIKGGLSGRGLLGSGFLDRAATDVETNRLSQYGAFLRDVPRLNNESRMKNVTSLLGLGGQFGALAPRGQFTSGSASQSGSQNQQSSGSRTTTGNMTGNTVQQGPSNVMGNIGGALGAFGAQGYGDAWDAINEKWG